MKLYFSKGACSRSVRIILHELNIPAEFEAVDFKTKKTASGKDYLSINPKGAVPALQLNDGSVLTENVAIHQYLADTHGAHHLLPELGNFQRYRTLEWFSYISSDLHKSCGPLFNSAVPDELKETIFKPALLNKFKIVEQQLQKNEYLMGKEFTLPDAYLFVVISWLKHFNIDLQTALPNVSRYYNALKERKSIRQALEEEA
ncbi:glutathione S-transferase [Gammaproteobacteria bacterium SCGC AG-212-F23]|nr:glutathione S-transferase [Gammaproteobacteria bacterium SCGC AG-212-F23]